MFLYQRYQLLGAVLFLKARDSVRFFIVLGSLR